MELYIMRHGPAEEGSPSGSDSDRPLSAEGRERVLAVAKALIARESPTVIVTSPLARASATAEIVARECKGIAVETRKELAAGDRAMNLVRELIAAQTTGALLVGHEPDLSALVRDLTRHELDLEKAMIVGVTIPEKGAPRVRFVLHPKTLTWTDPAAT